MVIYDRRDSKSARIVAEGDGIRSWIAHPHEEGKRVSHAIKTDEGVWLVDPLDAPNVHGPIESLGEVVGVTVLSCYHARDAGSVARRYDVPVAIPDWMDRIESRVEYPVDRYTDVPGSPAAGFSTYTCRPFPDWQEVFLYHEPSATLCVADSLGTSDQFLVGDERLGLGYLRRLQPPTKLRDLDPDRVLVGHGEPILDDASSALERALDGARRSFPKALLENGIDGTRAALAAFRD